MGFGLEGGFVLKESWMECFVGDGWLCLCYSGLATSDF